MFRIFCLFIGYGFGCIQPAYFITRGKTGKDIRSIGTGNMGTANVTQSVGLLPGLVTFVLDLLKTMAAVWTASLLLRATKGAGDAYLILYTGAGVILGHDFPFYLRFRGGKGLAATIGILLLLDGEVLLLVAAAAALALLSGNALVLAVVALDIALPLSLFALGYPLELVFLSACLGSLMIILHRSSFRRMRHKAQTGESAAVIEK